MYSLQPASSAIPRFRDFYIASLYQAVTDWLYVCVGYQTFLTNFGGLYLTEFLTDFGQILDSNSYDQA